MTLASMLNHEILSEDEEIVLLMTIEIGDLISHFEGADNSTNIALHERDSAEQTLIEKNIRLAVSWFRKARIKIDDDKVQDGVLGLCDAIRRFDRSYGVRFSTYASWWIKKMVQETVWKGLPMRITAREAALSGKINKDIEVLRQKLMREPTPEEISTFTGFPATFISYLCMATKEVLSTDDTIPNSNDTLLEEFIIDKQDAFGAVENRLFIQSLMATTGVPNNCMEVILMRTSIDPYSYDEIAEMLDLSPRYAKFLFKRGIKTMQEYFKARPSELKFWNDLI